MARNKFEERNIRKLTKIAGGSSYAVTLPIEYVREFNWRERQKLVITKVGKTLVIKDWEG
jgi:antitoxin component of MazEF toxin-antitoxin module